MKKVILLSVFLLLGCSPPNIGVEVIRFDDTDRTPTSEIIVYSSPESVKRPYSEIGKFISETKEETSKVVLRFKEEAAKLGADAIILLPKEERTSAYIPIGGMVIPAKKVTHNAIAIILK